MKQRYAQLAAVMVAALFAGCSQSGANPPTAPNQANTASNVLQLSVGTANLFGDVPASAVAGTNVVVTYRQPSGALNPGASGALVSSPTLAFPTKLTGTAGTASGPDSTSTILNGVAPSDLGTLTMTSTAQNASNLTTFGTSGGAFALGLEPFNYNNQNGVPGQTAPYPVPLLDAIKGDPNAFIPFGGLPAFNPAGNAANPANAISEGIDVFAIAPIAGTYGLSVNVSGNTGSTSNLASASITNAALLPAILPAVPTVDANGDGGASFTLALPSGVTEAYVQVVDYGPTTAKATSCSGASAAAPIYMTIAVPTNPLKLPAGSLCSASANTTATGSASDGDSFSVQTIGFDYPAYESSLPNSLHQPAPTIKGANGQSDITISSQAIYTQPTAGGLTRIQSSLLRTTH